MRLFNKIATANNPVGIQSRVVLLNREAVVEVAVAEE
jgi:hypothetical protein